jgi:hypothetical protein
MGHTQERMDRLAQGMAQMVSNTSNNDDTNDTNDTNDPAAVRSSHGYCKLRLALEAIDVDWVPSSPEEIVQRLMVRSCAFAWRTIQGLYTTLLCPLCFLVFDQWKC